MIDTLRTGSAPGERTIPRGAPSRIFSSESVETPASGASLIDGASRTRTGDLLGAIQALSQLSYSPAALVEQSSHPRANAFTCGKSLR
jgi:hypothetical protein